MAGLMIIAGLIVALLLLDLAALRWGADTRDATLILDPDGRLRRIDERDLLRGRADV
jgi:hypothetical protein